MSELRSNEELTEDATKAYIDATTNGNCTDRWPRACSMCDCFRDGNAAPGCDAFSFDRQIIAHTVAPLLAEVTRLRTENERISATWAEVIQREERTDNAAFHDVQEARAETAAARAEVSQLRAKIDGLAEDREMWNAKAAAAVDELYGVQEVLAEVRADNDRLAAELFARESESELLRGGLTDPVDIINALSELFIAERDTARVREGNLATAVADLVWKATQYGETEDGDTFAYIVPKGAMHRLVGVAQQNGAHVPVSFRAPTAEPSGTPVSDKPASQGRSE